MRRVIGIGVVVVFVIFFSVTHIAHAETVTVNCSGTSGSPTAVDEASLAADDVTFSDTGGDGYCTIDEAISAASVIVGSGVVLTHPAGDADGLTITTTGNMTITGNINVDQKGCGTITNQSTSPNGSNVCSNGGAGAGIGEGVDGESGAGGAAHGGTGGYGRGTGGVGALTYDSSTNPVLFGAQGGNGAEGATGPGGGLVLLSIGGDLAWNGAVTALGANGWAFTGTATGGSAGGSINIQVAGAISGTTGTVAADGGDGATFWNSSGGGGGGIDLCRDIG